MTAPQLLRAALLVLLAAAAWWAPEGSRRAEPPGVLRLPEDAWYRRDGAGERFAGRGTPRVVARPSTEPPTAAELDALAALAAPVYAALPQRPGALTLLPPERPMAGRAAAVGFRLLGQPGDTAWVRLSDETGIVDSARVRLDSTGVAVGGLRVRPARSGWRRWRVDAGALRASTGAWVAPARPLRVLVRAGAPGWESKFVVRALEETGVELSLAQPLGSGLVLRAGEAPALAPAALERTDAVVLLPGASLGSGEDSLLAEWVSRGGGGVLAAGAAPPPLRAAAGARAETAIDAAEIRWSLPPELTPLPDTALRVEMVPLGVPLPAAQVAARAPAGPVLLLRPLGAGRIAQLGLTDSWRWRMEAGAVEAHRAFWRSLAEWLAAGAGGGPAVTSAAAEAPLGAVAEVRVTGAPDARALRLERPDGRAELLPLGRDPERPGTQRARFVPVRAGTHRFALDGAAPSSALEARTTAAAEAPWARLALLAARSGGAAVPAERLGAELDRLASARVGSSRDLRPWLFGTLLAVAAAEWALRRLRGRA